jgi:hypothetical protein
MISRSRLTASLGKTLVIEPNPAPSSRIGLISLPIALAMRRASQGEDSQIAPIASKLERAVGIGFINFGKAACLSLTATESIFSQIQCALIKLLADIISHKNVILQLRIRKNNPDPSLIDYDQNITNPAIHII